MGMSATQARFLSLTARKSNVEFEGQQINQQRTTLSNESASYYSQLCDMEVPTPPSVDDYTKVSYTFNDGAMTNTIISMLAKGNGEYSISYLQQWQDDYSITPASSSLVAREGSAESGYVYKLGSKKLRNVKSEPTLKDSQTQVRYYYMKNNEKQILDDFNYDVTNPKFTDDENNTYIVYREFYTTDADGEKPVTEPFDDEYYNTLTDEQRGNLIEEEEYYNSMLQDKFGTSTNWQVRYIKNTTTGAYEPYFYQLEDLQNDEKYTTNGLANINCYSLGSSTQTKEVLNQLGTVEKDSSGRYMSITLYDDNGNPTEYSLTTTTTTDEEAYNDAMNEYNYKQHQYDHQIQEINSKLEILQQQDKNLELKLKQLDTEENAISTEIDAVKKVISKNVESSFKTFNA